MRSFQTTVTLHSGVTVKLGKTDKMASMFIEKEFTVYVLAYKFSDAIAKINEHFDPQIFTVNSDIVATDQDINTDLLKDNATGNILEILQGKDSTLIFVPSTNGNLIDYLNKENISPSGVRMWTQDCIVIK